MRQFARLVAGSVAIASLAKFEADAANLAAFAGSTRKLRLRMKMPPKARRLLGPEYVAVWDLVEEPHSELRDGRALNAALGGLEDKHR